MLLRRVGSRDLLQCSKQASMAAFGVGVVRHAAGVLALSTKAFCRCELVVCNETSLEDWRLTVILSVSRAGWGARS